MDRVDVKPITYTYLCADGIWRTRCKEHARSAKGTRFGISPHFPPDLIQRSTAQCVECTMPKPLKTP